MNDFKRYTVIYISFVLVFFFELTVFSRKVISSSNQLKISNSDKNNLGENPKKEVKAEESAKPQVEIN